MPSPLPLSYCAQAVRAGDPDRYLCALFVPAALREAWFTLFALHAELRDIPHKVTEDMIGFIRFAWWREALDEVYGGGKARQHPVVEALGQAVAAYDLPREPLDTLIAAHEQNLLREAWADAGEAQAYCAATGGALMRACGHCADASQVEAYGDAGTAWALVELGRYSDAKDEASIRFRGDWLRAAEALQHQDRAIAPSLLPFVRTTEFYRRRLGAGKTVRGPGVRLRLMLRLAAGR